MKFSQNGTVMFVAAGLVFTAATIILAQSSANDILLFPIGILILIVLLIFYKLDIEITNSTVNVRFGVGLIHSQIALSNIIEAKVVRNSWWMGWGIRFSSNYTLYSVSGLDAVELTLKGKKSKIRIGTNAPEELAYQINRRLSS